MEVLIDRGHIVFFPLVSGTVSARWIGDLKPSNAKPNFVHSTRIYAKIVDNRINPIMLVFLR